MENLASLLARGDLDELVAVVDRMAATAAWDDLMDLRTGCATAAEDFGRQLWGVAQFAEYRIALDAPADLAAAVVLPGAARFALGPLTEVVAQNHAFDTIADALHPAVVNVVAQERVLRGEDLTPDVRHSAQESGLPGRIQPWEPAYRLPTYRRTDRLDGDPPTDGDAPFEAIDADPKSVSEGANAQLERALGALVEAWVRESAGEATTASVAGDAPTALAAIGIRQARLRRVALPQAIGLMASAASSGGAAGRRRGGAAGRLGAWWVVAAACGVELPVDPDELEFAAEERRWYSFEVDVTANKTDSRPASPWSLQLVVEDPTTGVAAAIAACDWAEASSED